MERERHGDPWDASVRSALDRSSYSSIPAAFSRVPGVPELFGADRDRFATAARFGSHIAAAPSFGRPGLGLESPLSALSGPSPLERAVLPPTGMELNRMSEKEKMLIGKPYSHWWDKELTEDRDKCRLALDHYNNACRPSSGVRATERANLFLDAIARPVPQGHPRGSVGNKVLVDAPFQCDYGYNIHIGDDVIIGSGCVFQDPCRIIIGARCIIGPNVKFYGMTVSVDPTQRTSAKLAIGGSITVEDDCFIGGDAIILGHRTIKKGSTIGAGTVVTRDVQSNMVVAGSPMRTLRGLGPGRDLDKHTDAIQRENDMSAERLLVEGGYRVSRRV